jgi:hypothetical protein
MPKAIKYPMHKSITFITTLFAFISMFTYIADAQRMEVKKHLGYDFNNNADEIIRYYDGLGANVVRENIQFQETHLDLEPVEVHSLSFAHTPLFLSVATSYINIGLVNGRIEVITIITRDDRRIDFMDHRLHKYSAGNVEISDRDGSKEILWRFDDCAIIKEAVSLVGDSARYFKYDIVLNNP